MHVLKLDISHSIIDNIRKTAEHLGFSLNTPGNYQSLNLKRPDCNIILYSSGKMVIQGRQSEHYFMIFSESLSPSPYAHYGSDEAGKGDFFGPLTVCSCYVSEKDFRTILTLGIKESKGMSRESVHRQAKELKSFIPYKCVVISPEKYNSLYKKIGNLNKMLDWAHKKSNSLLCDIMGNSDDIYIDKYSKSIDISIPGHNIIKEEKAERHPAVGAASIIAKQEFISWIEKKEKEIGMKIPLGSSNVKSAAVKIAEKKGIAFLETLCKKHFRTYGEIRNIISAQSLPL
ncbi:MAG: ribonuclease HIII [Candidatus Muiribacteriaceae bacterium]